MKHQLGDLLDIPRLQCALDSLYISSRIPSAIIDNDGIVHTGSGWQDVCTKFHRVHPEARKRCVESDTYIADHIHEANPSITYICPHGLVDAATPIIIEGDHLGNVFTGQLFLEEPDLGFFRAQAKAFGFDEETYIEAVNKVPVISEKAFQENLAFVAHLTGMLAEMGRKRAREKEAEKRLSESEERYRAVVDGLPDVVMRFDRDGRHLFVSDNVTHVVDLTAEQFIGKTHGELGFPEAQSRFWEEAIRGVFTSAAPYETEFTLEGKQGPVIFNWRLVPELDAQGMVRSVLSFKRDITEHRQAEESLRETEVKYRSLFEHMQEGCAYCRMIFENGDPVDFTYVSVNAAFEALTGLKHVAGKRVSEVIPGIRSSDPALFEAYGRVAHTGKPEKIEIFIEALQQWYSISIYSPEQGYFVAVFDVITDRKRSEETARRETSLRNVLLDNLPCIALVLKKRTREIVACNEIAKNYGAAIGKICHDALAVPGTPCPFCLSPEVWETGESKQIEVEYMGRFWHGIWVPFSDDLYVHYIFEITDRKRAEVEKKKLQDQLLQAMKMEAVGRLAGGVAHDFNNLLTVIIGNVALALMKLAPSDPAKGMLDEANKAAERATRLTQQLLAFSRKQIIEPKVQDINLLMTELDKMLIRLIGENIELKTIPGEDLGLVKVDAGQFEQILVNLAVNARDAMPDGGKVVIETSNAELDGDYCSRHPYVTPGKFVMVAVSDTGHGMSEEVKGHIFEPFFTTKAKGCGTGLGLATTYGAVKQAGGSIEVYSEVGVGTTFRIYLPRVEGEPPEIVGAGQPGRLQGGTETVLLVEDEEIVRNLAVRVLDASGYRVLQAGNGDEAITLALGCGERIDLLLTDVVMPGMSGRELANRLTQLHPETRVLFTSGYTDDAIVHHGVLDEGVSFIGKPYTPSALARKVREVLGVIE